MTRAAAFALAMLLSATGVSTARADRFEDCDQLEDLDLAIKACTQIIKGEKREKRDEVAQAYSNRGFAYAERGQLDRAIRDYNQSLKHNPKDDNVYHYRGVAYLKKRQYARAVSEFDKALKIEPYNAFAHEDRALALLEWKKPKSGLYAVNKAIKLNPEQASFYATRGRIHETMGKKEKAIQDYASAHHLSPTEAHKQNLKRLGVTPHQ